MTRHGLSLRALHMSMTHTPERRRIPHLDERWSIDQSGQVYGASDAPKIMSLREAIVMARKRLRCTDPLAATGTVQWLWYPVRESQWSAAVDREVVAGKRMRTLVAATGMTIEARGDVDSMWFTLHADQGKPEETVHLLHGPSVAAIVFQSA